MPRSPSRSFMNMITDFARSQSRARSPAPAVQSLTPVRSQRPSTSPLLSQGPGLASMRTSTRSDAAPPSRHLSSGVKAGPPTADHSVHFPEEHYMLSPVEHPYGYFPMRLGQKLRNGRFEIVRKLGWGTHASVWLAKENLVNEYRYVAIKVLTVNATWGEKQGVMHEIAVAQGHQVPDSAKTVHPGYWHCASSIMTFNEYSVHGEHACIVYEPYGTSLGVLLQSIPQFPLPAVKSISRQVLLGLSYMHDLLHVVHADLKKTNILIKGQATTAEIDRFLADNPAQTYPDPVVNDPRISPDPILPVVSQPLPNFGLAPSLKNIEIRLVDYGASVQIDKIQLNTLVFTAGSARAPELLLGGLWAQSTDIWAVGCLILEILTGVNLYPVSWTDGRYSLDAHLMYIYGLLGPFPMDLVQRCTKGEKLIDATGKPFRGPPCRGAPFERRFEVLRPDLSAEEASAACNFVRRCLAMDPQARPSARDLLSDPWLAS